MRSQMGELRQPELPLPIFEQFRVGQVFRLLYSGGTQTDACLRHVEERGGIKFRLFRRFPVFAGIDIQVAFSGLVDDSRQMILRVLYLVALCLSE